MTAEQASEMIDLLHSIQNAAWVLVILSMVSLTALFVTIAKAKR